MVVYLIAAWAILTTGAEIAIALAFPETLAHPWLAGFLGLLSVIFGLLLAVWPCSGAVALTWLVGIYAIAYSVTLLYYAYRLQALRNEARSLGSLGQRTTTEGAHGQLGSKRVAW